MRLLGSTLLVLSMFVLVPGDVAACSCSIEPGPRATPQFPWFSAADFPANGLFSSSLEWHDASGAALVLAPDTALSSALGFDVRRPAADLSADTTFFPGDDCPGSGSCRRALVVGAADTIAPSAAEVVDLTVVLADDAPETGVSCQVDSLVLEVSGTDDRTPQQELVTVVFVGATQAEAMSSATFALGFARDGAPGTRDVMSTITLGGAEGHRRDGGPLRETGTFCIAVALMDWAGNVGPRSAARCLDTRDSADPSVMLVPYEPPCSGPFCAISPARSAPPFAAAAALALAIAARRRRTRAA